MQIMPSEVDKQDLDTLMWIMLSENESDDSQYEDSEYMGLF